MSPNELVMELQSHDFDYFLQKMLDAVPEDIDKREGSIIYDALAPAAMVSAIQSLDLANIVKETYIKTAEGEFLDYRAVEHNTSRYPATNTEVKAVITDDDNNRLKVNIGDKFSSVGDVPIFYTVTKINQDLTVEMQADEVGTRPNPYIGQVLPVTPNDLVNRAEIIEIIAPARDVETDDHLRERLLNSKSYIAYGGNIADYLDMASNISEIGATQVYPVWDGPGTVKLVILDNDLKPATKELCQKVKEIIDPADNESLGVGLAPIDHKVTVVAPTIKDVSVKLMLKFDSMHDEEEVKEEVTKTVNDYFDNLRKNWPKINQIIGRGYQLTVYRSKLLSQIMLIDGVVDSQLPILNGKNEDVPLTFTDKVSEIPNLKEVIFNA